MADEFARHIVDSLYELGDIETARFFGGTGLKLGGVQFAMITRGVLYFVVDDALRERFRCMGSEPFSYATKQGQRALQRYYSVPDELLDTPDALYAAASAAFAHARATSRGARK